MLINVLDHTAFVLLQVFKYELLWNTQPFPDTLLLAFVGFADLMIKLNNLHLYQYQSVKSLLRRDWSHEAEKRGRGLLTSCACYGRMKNSGVILVCGILNLISDSSGFCDVMKLIDIFTDSKRKPHKKNDGPWISIRIKSGGNGL